MSEIDVVNVKDESVLDNDSTIKCLDKGFVRLIDVMGDDGAVVQAARVSYGKGTKNQRRDQGLINYLMKHQHNSPFEMVEFKFHCKMPIFVARQWVRHRTANINEISGRYSIMEDTVWEIKKDDLRQQSKINRQGSVEETVPEPTNSELVSMFKEDQNLIFEHYNESLEKGVAREVARTNLPLSTYTEWYWKIDLHNLLHFLELRTEAHAQKEIRVYAGAMSKFVERCCPMAWNAFQEFRLQGTKFSGPEMHILRNVISENWLEDKILELRLNQLKEQSASDSLIKVELAELRSKLSGKKLE
jgi:thymidylate synthase (FAD)